VPAAAAARQPCRAAQFAAAMAAVGQPVNLREPEAVSLIALVESGQERQLTQLTAAATRQGASKLQGWGSGLVTMPRHGSRHSAPCTGQLCGGRCLGGRGGGGHGSLQVAAAAAAAGAASARLIPTYEGGGSREECS
jgi:hypothetical protein